MPDRLVVTFRDVFLCRLIPEAQSGLVGVTTGERAPLTVYTSAASPIKVLPRSQLNSSQLKLLFKLPKSLLFSHTQLAAAKYRAGVNSPIIPLGKKIKFSDCI